MLARHNYATKGDFDTLSDGEQFRLIHNEIGKEFTLYFKKLRKAAKNTRLRYLLVAEAHKDGFPHYHAFLHEHGEPVGK